MLSTPTLRRLQGMLAAAGIAHVYASVRELPRMPDVQARRGISFDIPEAALARWNAGVHAKDGDNTISIYDSIGYDPWTGDGTTAKRISAALRSIGAETDVTVNINSPGGDVFEGMAIYNLFNDHKGKVTMRVVGLAASAASLIAMAGDEIQVARAGFLMVHNVWVLAIGNRHDLRAAADTLETFDDALASVYAARTGMEKKAVAKLMDAETWMNGEQAMEEGFADGLLPADQIEEEKVPEGTASTAADFRAIEVALARAGMSRGERRALFNRIKTGTPSAAGQDRDTPRADPLAEPPIDPNGTPSAAETEIAEAGAKEAQEVIDRMTGFLKTV